MNSIIVEGLKNWTTLNEVIPGLNEMQVKALLDHEVQHENRVTLVERLHQRYNSLRVARERKELLS